MCLQMAALSQNFPVPVCVIRPLISIRRQQGVWKAAVLSKFAASEVESFDLFILRMLSASLIFTTLFFPPPEWGLLSHLFLGGVQSEAFHGHSPRAGSPAHRPQSNYSERERTFLLFCERGISMAAVQLLNYFSFVGPAVKEMSSWDPWRAPPPTNRTSIPQTFWPILTTKKLHELVWSLESSQACFQMQVYKKSLKVW